MKITVGFFLAVVAVVLGVIVIFTGEEELGQNVLVGLGIACAGGARLVP